MPLDAELTLPFKVSFILNEQNGNNPNVTFNNKYVEIYNNHISINGTSKNHSVQLGKEYSISFETNKITVYCEDTSIGSVNASISQTKTLTLYTGGNRYCRLKNFKIHEL